MKTIRNKTFETNSSSTHALTFTESTGNYTNNIDQIKIYFADTDSDYVYVTLKEKVSYLVGHILYKYKWDCVDYDDLIEHVKEDYDFKRIEKHILDNYNKKIVFPKSYKGDIDNIVTINHQLLFDNLDDLLSDIIEFSEGYRDLQPEEYLSKYFEKGQMITIGRD